MSNDLQIRSLLKRLRLPVVAQNYTRLAEEAAANNKTFQDYLFALLEGEVIQRDDHAQKLRLLRARFPFIKTMDNFEFNVIPSLNKALVLELSRGTFIDRRENVIFIGSYGTGKTHLAISLAVAACHLGKKVRFYTVAGLINELLEAQSQLRLGKLESALAKIDLIVLDEQGFVPFTKEGAEALFTFCSSRYERGSLVITTNLDFVRWKEIFGDEALTGALLDRLTHRCH